MQLVQADGLIRIDESSELLAPEQEKSGFFGRSWKWIKDRSSTILKGAVATASTVSLVTIGYFIGKEIAVASSVSMMHPLGIGAGLAIPALLGTLLPQAPRTALADWVSRWSFEILQAMTEFYVRAGCPMVGRGLWNAENPPLLARQLATFAFSATATALTALALRTFTVPENEASRNKRERPLRLFLESGAHENRRLFFEQLAKAALGLGSLGLYRWEGSDEWLYFAYYLFGAIGGTAVSKAYLWLRERTIERIQNKTFRAIVNKTGVTAELVCFGAFLAWPADASYLLSGAMAGAVKIASLDKFQYLSQNDEQVAPFQLSRIDNIAKGFFLTLNFTWFISMIVDPGLPRSQRAGIVSFLVSSLLAYPLTRYLAANFRPDQEDNPLFNSFRFYGVNFEEALLLPYMFIKDADDVGIIGNDEQNLPFIKSFVGLTSLGLAIGNNRALQGLRSDRSPSAVSDLALLISWFILYRHWQK